VLVAPGLDSVGVWNAVGMRVPITTVAILGALLLPGLASAAPSALYGVQDDAWLRAGPGTLDERLDTLEDLNVQIVRYTLRWDRIAAERPARARDPEDPAYNWGANDGVLSGLRDRGIPVVLTIWGTPGWANGGRGPSWAPRSSSTFLNFTHAAAERFPWVRRWLIWNEPNQQRWFRPASAQVYTRRLLNPAYRVLKSRNERNLVGGGVTAPRGHATGVAPVRWIREMKAARARFDAYAHHPYPLQPGAETPFTGGCTRSSCLTITMASLERLLAVVRANFGAKRIWLTEWGYQTNPPEWRLGVSPALQARYVSEALLRAWLAPRVDMLVNFLVRDDTFLDGWQSGFITGHDVVKPSYRAFMLPLAQRSRAGTRTVLWGQVRPRSGRQPYRLQRFVNGRWKWIGPARWTNARGVFERPVQARPGTQFRVWSPRDRELSAVLVVA